MKKGRPQDMPQCACRHSWREHLTESFVVSPGLETACSVRGCYCLAYLAPYVPTRWK